MRQSRISRLTGIKGIHRLRDKIMVTTSFSTEAKKKYKVGEGVCDFCEGEVPVTHVYRRFANFQPFLVQTCATCWLDMETGGLASVAKSDGLRMTIVVNPKKVLG